MKKELYSGIAGNKQKSKKVSIYKGPSYDIMVWTNMQTKNDME
jgi:hypothetical protein